MDNINEAAKTVLLQYIQSWGQSVQDGIDALNSSFKAVGLDAEFLQKEEGGKLIAGFIGEDREEAKTMRQEIDQIQRGSFEDEQAQIASIIRKRVVEKGDEGVETDVAEGGEAARAEDSPHRS